MGIPIYLDPTTDFGFKRIFGTDANKDLLKAFLNDLFRGRKFIADLHYNKNEHVGETVNMGGVIFDLTCTASTGEQFIIEVQRTSQTNLKRRMLYYGSKLISDQAPKAHRKDWNYAISEVYVIVLMDSFPMPDSKSKRFLHDICLCNRVTGDVFYPDLGFIYLELINFTKGEAELVEDLDKWLYILKNMSSMDKLPTYLHKSIFEKLFHIAEYGKLNKVEKAMYDESLKHKWDAATMRELQEQEVKDAILQGKKEGKRKNTITIAQKLKKMGLSLADIAEGTGLTISEIEELD